MGQAGRSALLRVKGKAFIRPFESRATILCGPGIVSAVMGKRQPLSSFPFGKNPGKGLVTLAHVGIMANYCHCSCNERGEPSKEKTLYFLL